MIHGASIRRARRKRASAETATIAVSHAQIGTAATSGRAGARVSALTAKPDLAKRRAEPVGVVEADVGRARGHAAEQLLLDDAAPRGLFERRDVEGGDAVDVVLAR